MRQLLRLNAAGAGDRDPDPAPDRPAEKERREEPGGKGQGRKGDVQRDPADQRGRPDPERRE